LLASPFSIFSQNLQTLSIAPNSSLTPLDLSPGSSTPAYYTPPPLSALGFLQDCHYNDPSDDPVTPPLLKWSPRLHWLTNPTKTQHQ